MSKPDYDTSVARMAGNIATGFIGAGYSDSGLNMLVAQRSVELARAIVAEVKRTEPAAALRDAAEAR